MPQTDYEHTWLSFQVDRALIYDRWGARLLEQNVGVFRPSTMETSIGTVF